MVKKKKQYVSDIITKERVDKWGLGDNILISTPPDTGKTYFIRNVLGSRGENILIVSNRIYLKSQIDKSIMDMDNIDVVNYQKLEKDILDNKFNVDNYTYLVLEESHYYFEDAKFNTNTDLVLNRIIDDITVTKIFISGTPQVLELYFKNMGYKFNDICNEIKPDYSFIDSISVFQDFNTIDNILQTIPIDEKAIIFSNKIDDLYKLSQKYSGAFICSKDHKKYGKKINQEELNSITDNECFNTQFLFVTKALDNGVNIVDKSVKHIILDIHDKVSFIQCLGRKRIKGNEKIHLYFRDVKEYMLESDIKEAKRARNLVQEFKEKGEYEFVKAHIKKKYNHNLIYDIVDDETKTTHKKVNECLYYKYYTDMLFYTLITGENEEKIKKSFVKIICDDLGFNHNDIIKIDTTPKQQEITEYLKSLKGKKLYKTKQEEIIKKLNVRRDGHLRKSITSLNASLEEDNIPFIILHSKEKRTGRKPRTVWMIKNHDWSELEKVPEKRKKNKPNKTTKKK